MCRLKLSISSSLHDFYGDALARDLKAGRLVAKFDDNNRYHCDNGPAITRCTGMGLMWYNHGLLHRADGPATMMPWEAGWWINGELITSWSHYQEITACTYEHLVVLKLRWDGPMGRHQPNWIWRI